MYKEKHLLSPSKLIFELAFQLQEKKQNIKKKPFDSLELDKRLQINGF